jgi:DNA-binding XRE family transcriptional regulator
MPYNAYLRQLRVKWMLSQEELAKLLDISQARISRYEKGEEYPTLSVALGLQVIFSTSPKSVFSHLYSAVEDAVMGRTAEFESQLIGRSDFGSRKKRQLFQGMMDRATNRVEA